MIHRAAPLLILALTLQLARGLSVSAEPAPPPPNGQGGRPAPQVTESKAISGANAGFRPSAAGQARLDQAQLRALSVHCSVDAIRRAISAAVQRADLGAEAPRSWRRRLKWSAVLPKLSAQVGEAQSSAQLVNLRSNGNDGLDLNNYLAQRWEVRATWDLSRLVFDPRELRVSARANTIAAQRQRLAERVVELYFRRCRLLLMTQAQTGSGRRTEDLIELNQVTALLDELTDGQTTQGIRWQR